MLRKLVRLLLIVAACLPALTLSVPAASAASGRTLVFGAFDNGFEADNAAATLTAIGASVDRSSALPEDLTPHTIAGRARCRRLRPAGRRRSSGAAGRSAAAIYIASVA